MSKRRSLFPLALGVAGLLPAIVFACNGSGGALTGGPGGQPSGEGGSSTEDGASPGKTGIDAPVSLIVDSAKPDTSVPLNAVDAADIAEGGLRVSSGVITCGTGTCNEFASLQCCVGDDASSCQATGLKCAPGMLSLTCNESADCVVGKLCCATAVNLEDSGNGSLASACAATCALPVNAQMCRTNGECGDAGPCVVQTCSDGITYELCGVYNTPEDAGFAFNCTAN